MTKFWTQKCSDNTG